jgi:hypothetical protein
MLVFFFLDMFHTLHLSCEGAMECIQILFYSDVFFITNKSTIT